MADRTVDILLQLKSDVDKSVKKITKALKQVEKQTKKTDASAKKLSGSMSTLGKTFASIIGIGVVINRLKGMFSLFATGEQSTSRLNAALSFLGGNAAALAPKTAELTELFRKFGATQTDVDQVMARFIINLENIEQALGATRAALFISNATGSDFNSTITQLSQTFIGALPRETQFGLAMKDVAEEIKEAATVGERFNIVMRELPKFQDLAEAQLGTTSNTVAKFTAQMSELEEAFGGFIALVEDKLGVLRELTEVFSDARVAITSVIDEDGKINTAALLAEQERTLKVLIKQRDKLLNAPSAVGDVLLNLTTPLVLTRLFNKAVGKESGGLSPGDLLFRKRRIAELEKAIEELSATNKITRESGAKLADEEIKRLQEEADKKKELVDITKDLEAITKDASGFQRLFLGQQEIANREQALGLQTAAEAADFRRRSRADFQGQLATLIEIVATENLRKDITEESRKASALLLQDLTNVALLLKQTVEEQLAEDPDNVLLGLRTGVRDAQDAVVGWGELTSEVVTDTGIVIADFGASAFTGFIEGTLDAKTAVRQLFADLFRDISQAIVRMTIFRALFGGVGASAGGGLFSSLLGGLGVSGFAAGGAVAGAGNATSDSVPIMASAGEYVVKAKSAQHYGGRIMSAINEGMLSKDALAKAAEAHIPALSSFKTNFATGGPVIDAGGANAAGSTIVQNVVAIGDNEVERIATNARMKDSILATIKDNPDTINNTLRASRGFNA